MTHKLDHYRSKYGLPPRHGGGLCSCRDPSKFRGTIMDEFMLERGWHKIFYCVPWLLHFVRASNFLRRFRTLWTTVRKNINHCGVREYKEEEVKR